MKRKTKTRAAIPSTESGSLRPAVLLTMAALAVQWLLWAQYRGTPFDLVLISDALSYDTWARRLAERGFAAEPAFHQAPLYPLFLSLFYDDPENGRRTATLFQGLLGAIAIGCLVPIGHSFLGSRRAGIAGGLLALLHGPLALHHLKLLPVALPLALQTAGLAALGQARLAGSLPWAAACGGLTGLACLARAETQLFVPFALLALGIRLPARDRPGVRVLPIAFLAAFALTVAPVMLHNASRGGGFSIATAGGENLFIGNQRGADGAHMALHPQAGDIFSQRELAVRLAEESRGEALDPKQVDRYWKRRAFDEIAADPLGWVALEGAKLARVLDPGDPADMYAFALERNRYLPLLHLLFAPPWLLLIPGAAGLLIALRIRGRAAWPLALYAGLQLAVLLAFFVTARLRLPLLFVLAPFAGFAFTRLEDSWRAGRRRWVAAFGAVLCVAGILSYVASSRVPGRERVRLASTLSTLGHLDEGLDVLAPLTAKDSSDAVALDQAGWLLQKKGSLSEASLHYKRALEAGMPSGREASTRTRHADVLEALGDMAGAEREHRAAAGASGANAGTAYARGMFFLRQGRRAEARQALERAASLDASWPAPREALRHLGR